MAHKGDTQATSDTVPKVSHTIRRNGVFYFNARYPDSLFKAGLVKAKLNRRSLETKDWREAQRLAAREYNFHLSEIERMEAELEKPSIRFADLSKAERRGLVLRWFVEMEKKAEKLRRKFREDFNSEEREDALFTAREDMESYDGESFGPFDWQSEVSNRLNESGIEFKSADNTEEFIEFYRKATIESQWRTLQALKGEEHSKRDSLFKDLDSHSSVKTEVGSKPHSGRTIADLCAEYYETKSDAGRSPASLKSYNMRFEILKQCLGEKTFLSELQDDVKGYEAGKQIVKFLPKIPIYATQRYKGKTLEQASRLESKKANPQFVEAKTQRDYFTDIKGMLAFAVKRRWISHNPFEGLEDSLPPVEERQPEQLTGDELKTLLSSPEFLKERHRRAKGSIAEGRFWTVILCLFHGMRLNEASSLLVSDIKEEEGIAFMDFTELNEEGEKVKRLKTKASRRRVPLHKEVIRLGFLDFVSRRKDESPKPEDWLFPDLKPNNIGNRGAYTSSWFTRVRNKHLGKQKRKGDKSLHTLRHSMADSLRAVTESDEILFAIGGWESQGRENSSRRYGKGSIKKLKEVIDKAKFPGFDPSFLYPENL